MARARVTPTQHELPPWRTNPDSIVVEDITPDVPVPSFPDGGGSEPSSPTLQSWAWPCRTPSRAPSDCARTPAWSPRAPTYSGRSPRYSPCPDSPPYIPCSPRYSPYFSRSPRSPSCAPRSPNPSQHCDSEFKSGDMSIPSKDSTIFFVRQAVLRLASNELANLVDEAVATTNQIELRDHSSDAVRALLRWIYPNKPMRIPNFDVLDEALAIADEYKLGAMRDALGTLMVQKDSPVYIQKDPIRAYGIATRRGLDLKAQEAARQTAGKVDFKREYVLSDLRKRGVSDEWAFKLAQKHFAWESALADVLLRSVEALMLEEEEWKVLVCAECVIWKEADGPAGLVEWQRNWIERVYERLVCTPLDDCAYMFRPEYVARVWDEGCERCMIRLMRSQDVLDEWMARVWSRLQGRWEDIFSMC